MSNRITVTSGELRSTSTQMQATAGQIGDQLRTMLNNVQQLTGTWTGQAASTFSNHYQTFNSNWSRCEAALGGIAQMLGSSAESYDQTERAIAARFAQS